MTYNPSAGGGGVSDGDKGSITVSGSGAVWTLDDGVVTNAKVDAAAGIVDTKLATISTAGKVANSATTATALNTASAIVARDGGGNFAAGTITAALSGNASTATALQAGRTIGLSGDVTATGVIFDGTGNITLSTALGSGVIVDADVNASAAIADTKLATISTAGKVANSATTATSANTASAIVARDASGNFSTGTVTATFSGNGSALTNLDAGALATGTVGTARLGSGTANSTTFLRGDNTWATPAAGGVSDGDKGDITVSGSGATWTIDNGVITNDKVSGSAGIVDTKLATISTAGKVSNSATTATSANTASAIVARDASGNFSAGTITATFSGNGAALTNLDAGALATGTVGTARLGSGTANSSTYLRGDGTWATPAGGSGPVVNVVSAADTAVNSTTNVTVATYDITDISAGDQIVVEVDFTILNNSGATRVYVLRVDFDGLFDVEHTTGSLTNSATAAHPFYMRAVLDVRSSSLAYATFVTEGQLAAGLAPAADTTMAATHLRAVGWNTTTSDTTGTTPVFLRVRSASATATQTLRLHRFTITKYRP